MEVGNFWAALASYRWVIFWLVVLWYFRHAFSAILISLASLCNRIKSTTFEFIGIKLGADTAIALGGEGLTDEKFNALLKAFQSPIVTNEEKIIRSQLAEAKCPDNQAIAVLISQLANRNILTLLCLIDRWIFEEQINLLSYLNTNNKTCTGSELNRFYVAWSEKYSKLRDAVVTIDSRVTGSDNITFESFLGFLIMHGLIVQNTSGYSITTLGKDYLSFIVRAGRQLPRDDANQDVNQRNVQLTNNESSPPSNPDNS